MYEYLIVNLIIIGLILIYWLVSRVKLNYVRIISLFAILTVFTAIFDSILIINKVYAYTANLITGIYIGRAPIEDFAYVLVVSLIVPILWEKNKND